MVGEVGVGALAGDQGLDPEAEHGDCGDLVGGEREEVEKRRVSFWRTKKNEKKKPETRKTKTFFSPPYPWRGGRS